MGYGKEIATVSIKNRWTAVKLLNNISDYKEIIIALKNEDGAVFNPVTVPVSYFKALNGYLKYVGNKSMLTSTASYEADVFYSKENEIYIYNGAPTSYDVIVIGVF